MNNPTYRFRNRFCRRLLGGLAGLMALTATVAQAGSPSPVEVLAKEDVKKARNLGRTIGAVGGAVVGYFIAEKNGKSDLEKGVIILGAAGFGGLVGDQLGKAIGETIARRRLEYGKEQAFLESEIQAANQAIATRERKLTETEAEIRARDEKIGQLEQSTHLTRAQTKQAKNELELVRKRIEENNLLLEEYKGATAYLDEALRTSSPEANAAEAEKKQWEEKKKTLEAKRAQLVAQSDQLMGIDQSLRIAESKLVVLVKK